MDAFTALHLYRMKNVVEKAFGNIKERLNMRHLLVSSEKGLDGKIFTEFVATHSMIQRYSRSTRYRQSFQNIQNPHRK